MTLEISILNTHNESDWTSILEVKSVENMSSLATVILNNDWSHSLYSESKRSLKNFICADVIALDFDGGYSIEHATRDFANYQHIIIPTKSHQIPKGDRPAEDRFRVVLRLSKRVQSIDEFNAIAKKLMTLFPKADPKAKDAARYWKCGFHEAVSVNNVGKLVEVADSISCSPPPASSTSLSTNTQKFILNGANEGEFNSSLYKAARECAEKGLPKEGFIQMAEPNTRDKKFDESDLKSIESAYKHERTDLGVIDARKASAKIEFLVCKLIMDIENHKKAYLYDESKDDFRSVDVNSIKFYLTFKEFESYKTQNGFSANIVYDPHDTSERLYSEGKDLVFNVYKKPKWMLQNSSTHTSLPQIYQDFFMHLTGNDINSYEYLLKWLANSLQARNRTILVAIGDQGIGKGVLGQILEQLHGKENYSLTGDVILKEKFNSPLTHKRLVHIDEINISKNTNAYNRLKVLIEDAIQIEEKGKDQKVIENHASVYLCSNDLDSLPLDEDQRRFSVIELTEKKLSDAEFVNINGGINCLMEDVLNEKNIASLGSYLLNYQIDKDEMQRPFLSARTKTLKDAMLKEWEEWFLYTWCPQNYIPLTDSLYEYEKRIKPEIKKEFPSLSSAPGRDKLESLAKRYPGHFVVQRKENKRFIKVLPPSSGTPLFDADLKSMQEDIFLMLDELEVS